MNTAVAATVFAVVFAAEVPDKTAFASLVLATRFRPIYVFVGAVFFFGAAVLLLRRAEPAQEPDARPARSSFAKAAAVSFAVILVAEFGDITQILVANLAARY